ncbi:MAG: undecaprenyl diphosphate synthase family protein [Desulfurococcales archaeon]|nr:undecaprenyl diphosphate synthase family protein [Desulfurococcales archaeon]
MSRNVGVPLHVGIIPDGNRRWARRHNVDLYMAYMRGYSNVKKISKRLYEMGIKVVTVYGLSMENCLRRPSDEKRIIEKVAIYALQDLRSDEFLRSRRIRLLILGDPGRFSRSVEAEALETSKALDSGDGGLLVLLICYSGRWEAEEYTSKGLIPPSLILPPIDLIIRTGGAKRLSGFPPLASDYAELFFSEKLWPDFTIEDAMEAVEWYARQKRNFGR